MKRADELKTRARAFALAVVRLAREIRRGKESILAAQFLRSGTSIGANLAEGRYTLTRGDRLAKHAIALKEAGETLYWIELFQDMGVISADGRFASLHGDCLDIIDILKSVIRYDRSSKRREEREAEAQKTPRRKAIVTAIDRHDRLLEVKRKRKAASE